MPKAKPKNSIVEKLKLSLIKGDYKPRERLVERDLAACFKTSRLTIREAIRKLEAIGMVQTMPNRGARVADFSSEEIEGLYLVRNHLEALAAKYVSQNISSDEIKTITEINNDLVCAASSGDITKMVEVNFKFHQAIIRASRNPFLIESIERLRSKCYLSQYFYWSSPQNTSVSIHEHKRIIRALLRNDKDELISLMAKHVNTGRDNYLKYLSELKKWRL